jgi:diguanylate cyclase (GGDEF)-like protein/PAS domain S-box-containing protein
MENQDKIKEELKEELSALHQQVNELEKLKSEHKRIVEELRHARDELSIRVKVRTAEIAKMNEDLLREIAERRRIEEALRDSQCRFQDVVDNAMATVWEVDNEGRYIYISPAVEKVLGYKPEEMLEKHFYDVFHPDDYGQLKNSAFAIIAKKEKFKNFINRNIHKDGQEVILETSGVPFFDGEGKVCGYRGVDYNITDRIKAERILKYRLELERLLVSISADFINIDISAIDSEINRSLREIGEFVGVDRSYVFLLSDDGLKTSNTHEWCAEGVEPQIAKLQGLSTKAFPWWTKKIYDLENIYIPRIAEMPPEAENEKKLLQKQGIQSLVVVPMVYAGSIMGFLGFDSVRVEKTWSEEHVTILRIAGDIFANVLQRKEIREKIIKNEAFLTSVFNSLQDGVSILDKELNIVRVNSTMEKWYSHTLPLVGKKCYQAYHSRNKACEICPTRKTIENKEVAYEVVPKCGPGGVIIGWLDLYSFPIFDTRTGEMTGIIEYVRDITERKQAEDMLRQSENRYRAIVEDQTELICRFLPNGNITFVNEAYCRYFGKKQEELIGESFMPLIPEEDWKKVKEGLLSLSVKNPVMTHEHRVILSSGEVRWQQWTNRVILDKEGKIIELQAVGRDITERKETERKFDLLNKELQKSNRKMKQLALKDPHTGLYNYHYLEEIIEAEFYRARRYAHSLSVIMLDIDYFKSINDVYGHLFGDLVLKQFAQQLKRMVRRYDILIRPGGEEFLILSPGTERSQALTLAQRLLDSLNLYSFGNKKHTVKLKLSISVVSYPEDRIVKGTDLIVLAEHMLNKIKEEGGNKVYSSLDTKKSKVLGTESHDRGAEVKVLKTRIDKLNKQANQSLIEAIFAFAKTIEVKDHYTGEHVEKTVHYATGVARELGLSKEEAERIKQAAMLHDLGKVGISENILLKKSKLTKKEFEAIKKHPQIGVDIIRPIQFLHAIIPLIFYHHERWDGKGYPSGLKGEDIPIGARIIALADVFQALISDRPYRKAYSKSKAIKIIEEGSGTQFDPQVVTALLKIIKTDK